MPTLRERFWSKVDIRGPDECWPWTAAKARYGYGKIQAKGRLASAHRVAYEFTRPIPEGMCVLHSCDNPPCCNPAHLWVGTHLENMRDRDAKRRCKNYGEHNWNSKLNRAQVFAIRQRLASGDSQRNIGIDFGVTQSAISDIARGRRWGWLAGES